VPRLISIVIPVYNEERNVRMAYDEVLRVMGPLQDKYEIEFVFTDNHSTDGTFAELTRLAKDDARVKVIRFNRNYGFQRSLMTAYRATTGDAAIQIDCDLQDPPALFPTFLSLWEQGHDVVVGIRQNRPEPTWLLALRRIFYRLLNAIAEHPITPDAGDFRLVDRKVLNHLTQVDDQSPYVRGLVASFASNEGQVPYNRNARQHGESKFPVSKLIGFALNGIFGHSTLPLRIASWCGLLIAVATTLLSAYYIIGALTVGLTAPRGFATTTVLILFGISLNAIFLGILGEYVSRIYQQVRQRPLTVVERTLNLPSLNPAERTSKP
jgi:dolichol-phosphate mannosyltransferase